MRDYGDEYGLDPMGRNRFFGIYEGTVVSVLDPLKKNRIQVTVEGPTGTQVTNWARAVLPITDSSYHPDHKAHLASEVAALLVDHSLSIGTSSGGSPLHTHTVTATLSHTGNSKKLTHAHVTPVYTKTTKSGNTYTVAASPSPTTDTAEASAYSGSQKAPDGTATPEHTFHRTVPVIGQKVWIMFIAGDPEYPVWIGVQ